VICSVSCCLTQRRLGRGVTLALAAAALLSACGGDSEPLTLKPAPARSGTPIDLDRPRDPSGAFAFDQWPRACDLLTDGEIKAVLPQAKKIEREPADQKINLVQTTTIGGTPFTTTGSVTALGATCTYRLDLPDAGLGFRDELAPATLAVDVSSAGNPAFVRDNFVTARDDRIKTPEGRCYVAKTQTGVSCIKGRLAFDISSHFDNQHVDFDKFAEHRNDTWTDRYQVKGTTTTFRAADSDSDKLKKKHRNEEFRRDHRDVELAKIVLGKI